MQEEMPDFGTVLQVLEAAQVRFVLIGGLAMIAHGSAQITQDIDVGYARDFANVQALSSALAPYHPKLRGAPPDLPFVLDARSFKFTLNMTLSTDLGPIDLLGEAAGIFSFDDLWEQSIVMVFYGVSVHVASLDDLIAMKRAAGRIKDQGHILELEALRKLVRENNNATG